MVRVLINSEYGMIERELQWRLGVSQPLGLWSLDSLQGFSGRMALSRCSEGGAAAPFVSLVLCLAKR